MRKFQYVALARCSGRFMAEKRVEWRSALKYAGESDLESRVFSIETDPTDRIIRPSAGQSMTSDCYIARLDPNAHFVLPLGAVTGH